MSFSRVTLHKNIWKDTHKWLDPDKQIVVKSMSFSRVTLRKNIWQGTRKLLDPDKNFFVTLWNVRDVRKTLSTYA